MIFIGRTEDGTHNVVGYGITGRSESSQDRRIVNEGEEFHVVPGGDLNPDQMALLSYTCVRRKYEKVFVSNGRQTDVIAASPPDNLMNTLVQSFSHNSPHMEDGNDLLSYEPDTPIYTPRISGAVLGHKAYMCVVRRSPGGNKMVCYLDLPLDPGFAHFISTYDGKNNVTPIPPFTSQAHTFELKEKTPQEVAEAFYGAMGPQPLRPDIPTINGDFRVSVLVIFQDVVTGDLKHHIVNRKGLE
jgi:IMP cyclohydrolase